jgi:hypothetical protein
MGGKELVRRKIVKIKLQEIRGPVSLFPIVAP